MANGYAKAKYGNSTSFKNFKLETDKKTGVAHNVYRILPPMKSLAANGKWFQYSAVHFGYRGIDKQDPEKTKMRTFRCIQDKDFKTGRIRVECPECTLKDKKAALLEARTTELKAAGMSAEDMEPVLAPLKTFLREHNTDRKILLAVISQSGEYGVLAIPNKTKKQLDGKIEQLVNNYGIDPLDETQGVWFDFVRNGRDFHEIQDVVEVVTENIKVDGKFTMSFKSATLTDEQLAQALQVIPDLTEVQRSLSRDQIQQLVDSDGDPEIVDAVFDMSIRRERSPEQSPNVRAESMSVKVTQTVPPESAELARVLAEKTALEARLKALETAATVNKSPELSSPSSAPAAATINAATMSNEEFIRRYSTPKQ